MKLRDAQIRFGLWRLWVYIANAQCEPWYKQMSQLGSKMQQQSAKKRTNRFWLYGPTTLLGLLVVGWCVGWFVLRSKVETMIDAQLMREAELGRHWECPERQINGFPFRFEISCANLAFRHNNVSASLGAVHIITQVYNPRHIIVEAAGPLFLSDGRVTASGTWKAFEASVSGIGKGGFERVSIQTQAASFTVAGLPELENFAVSSEKTALHVRHRPIEEQGTFDLALETAGAVIPLLNEWMGDNEPLQLEAQAHVNNASAFQSVFIVDALEQWRVQGGALKVEKLDTRKGMRVLTVKADIGLDELHRARGVIHLSQANYADLLARFTSGNGEKRPLSPLSPEAAKTPVTPLPPIQLANGKIKIAMFDIPKVRLAPLY